MWRLLDSRKHSACREAFEAPLAAQRAYAEERRARSRFGLMVPEAFVRGIRDLGYRSNGDAIAELIDNSLQAFADRVDILFGYDGSGSSKKPTQLAVIDNGHGMEPAMIRMAVMWGGTHREGDRSGLGRYGYGLPCASVSLGRRFTVYSQVRREGLQAVALDLDELAAGAYTDRRGEIVVPAPEPAVLPDFVGRQLAIAHPDGWTSGTVILIEKLDRLEWSTSQGLRDNLCRQFAVTYHKLRGEAGLYVDDAFVEPIDPLFLTPEFHLHSLDEDRARALDPTRIEVRDPETDAYRGAITLRYAWLPPSFGSIDKSRDAVGLNANARFSILKDYHGIIFSRNGRLIDVQTRTPWTSFINNDRYIKVELEFSATLDEAFGVTTSKQQVTVSPLIWDQLRAAGLPKAIEQLRSKVREAKLERRLAAFAPAPGERRLSEQAMANASLLSRDLDEPRQFGLNLRENAYTLAFESEPGSPFFRLVRNAGSRTLYLNTSHRFYDEIYAAPNSTAEVRSSLELLLFCFGDTVLGARDDTQAQYEAQILSWSRRLELALGMVAAHLSQGEDEDVGVGAWDEEGG
jgi:Histidine kinase-, DNA gyrase B-, and HSP90-like ATPase